ncbi:MAG: hypothetical protein ACKVIQ_13380 [Acidimicrobiales bacterium]
MSVGTWEYPYVGFFDRRSSDGWLWQGCKNIAEVVAGVAEIDAGCRRRR